MLKIDEQDNLRLIRDVSTNNFVQEIAIGFIANDVRLTLTVVCQKHFQKTGLFVPHLKDKTDHFAINQNIKETWIWKEYLRFQMKRHSISCDRTLN